MFQLLYFYIGEYGYAVMIINIVVWISPWIFITVKFVIVFVDTMMIFIDSFFVSINSYVINISNVI